MAFGSQPETQNTVPDPADTRIGGRLCSVFGIGSFIIFNTLDKVGGISPDTTGRVFNQAFAAYCLAQGAWFYRRARQEERQLAAALSDVEGVPFGPVGLEYPLVAASSKGTALVAVPEVFPPLTLVPPLQESSAA
jgi:hypothetical protein